MAQNRLCSGSLPLFIERLPFTVMSHQMEHFESMETLLIVGNHVSQQPNDKQEVEPALAQLDQLPQSLGQVEKAALDSGFFSAKPLL